MQIENRLRKDLNKRLKENNLRSLSFNNGIDFFSNDYLGFARNKALHQRISQVSNQNSINGATGSRLLSGNSEFCERIESQLAHDFGAEACLIFNSGYTANMAIISAIAKRGDTIIYDELAHACIKDGARLTLADRFSFKHNDLDDLKKKISKAKGACFLVVEAIYSMDGDEAPLVEITKLAKEYEALIIVDEAHATGIYGNNGAGLIDKLGLEKDVFARILTFGKARGIHGAAVIGNNVLKQYLVNFARPFIYTTALPPHCLIAIEQSFNYLKYNLPLQESIREKVALFNKLFKGKLTGSYQKIERAHPIQSIVIPGNENVKSVAKKIISNNFDVRPILSPTVKKDQERLRICLHTFNSNDEISALIDTLANLK